MKTAFIIAVACIVTFYVIFGLVVGMESSRMSQAFQRPITEMTRGELLAWLVVIAWIYSPSKKEKK